jgi:hypothetical protein
VTRGKASPQEVRAIVAQAANLPCQDCGAGPGEPCVHPGAGRSICRSRFTESAIAFRRQASARRRTPEQQAEAAAILANLPKVSRSEIEKQRTERGGYSFTREFFVSHGLPYPPISGWRAAVEQEDDSDDR